ncbi:PP2C family serine/threonine-protein phosphatase [Acinetobacter pollinis]|uniref:serine/threonine protein phosphatase n=1 Tax=Acinetobacter pollinis TaxID=2605270 RepID=UPI0018A2D8E9|nr:serine/threonine protein phosphatase [Acinetobacter pollinis]MBF7691287.1 serine/threonine protein phosphatase [Acinetobacter pollinis]MBF7698687.1 serine/threonine protein phosphatase [Acinetobacter pollinis]
MAESILIYSYPLTHNIFLPGKYGIDAIGKLTENMNLKFFYVLDGHSSCPNSDILVRKFQIYINSLKDIFSKLDDNEQDIQSFFNNLILNFFIENRGKLIPAAMSLCMTIFSSKKVYSAHLGDCRLGKVDSNKKIYWITYPHNLTMSLHTEIGIKDIEPVLKSSSNNHIVTKSFNTKRLKPISFNSFDLEHNYSYVIASDGFWKLPDIEILKVILEKEISKLDVIVDDTSLWIISVGKTI